MNKIETLKRHRKKRAMLLRERLKRLKIDLKFRLEDDTIAFYLPLEGETLVVFLDIWAKDTKEWWDAVGKITGVPFWLFCAQSLNRTYLHEFIHWACDEANDAQAELMAEKLSFGPATLRKLLELEVE
jgi:hypothetical protein